MPETPEVLFTKSAFKIATHCPTQAYYYRNSMSKKKKDGHYEHEGERDMIDLRKIGKSIYGSEIKSRNYTAESPLTLIVKNETGEVQNPYKDAIKYNALRKGLLKYCELDTMSMVLIWEYFNNLTKE